MIELPQWLATTILICVVLVAVFVGAFLGSLAGIDWERARAARDLSRKRKTITRALEHDGQ